MSEVRASSVAAVVVTFNRLALLQECLAALASQPDQLKMVYVVDNGSTDGTPDWFASSVHAQQPDRFQLIELGANVGGAGGFAAGMAEAVKGSADWLWLMDDDTIVQPATLSTLLTSSAAKDKQVGVLASKVIDQDGELLWLNNQVTFDPTTGDMHKVPERQFEMPEFAVDGSSFVGFLVRTEVVRQVGLPKADFFIHFDDHEYSLRIGQAGWRLMVVGQSLIVHKLKKMKEREQANAPVLASELWKYYYGCRNELWGLPRYIHPWTNKLLFHLRRLYWSAKRTARYLSQDHCWLRIRLEWQAQWDAHTGRLGKRIDPAVFRQRLENEEKRGERKK